MDYRGCLSRILCTAAGVQIAHHSHLSRNRAVNYFLSVSHKNYLPFMSTVSIASNSSSVPSAIAATWINWWSSVINCCSSFFTTAVMCLGLWYSAVKKIWRKCLMWGTYGELIIIIRMENQGHKNALFSCWTMQIPHHNFAMKMLIVK